MRSVEQSNQFEVHPDNAAHCSPCCVHFLVKSCVAVLLFVFSNAQRISGLDSKRQSRQDLHVKAPESGFDTGLSGSESYHLVH